MISILSNTSGRSACRGICNSRWTHHGGRVGSSSLKAKDRRSNVTKRQPQSDSKLNNNSTSRPPMSEPIEAAPSPSLLSELRRNGTPEIVVGCIILSLAGIDYAIQLRRDQQRDEMMKSLGKKVKADEEQSRKEDGEKIISGAATKYQFKCIVRRVPQNFDGHKCLTNVKVGDVLNVVEEGVGPGRQYNLCSIDRRRSVIEPGGKSKSDATSIGWFPCSCLEKMK
eukprot:scaffold1917_cov196-Alexandrium_tamarense.AAC.5